MRTFDQFVSDMAVHGWPVSVDTVSQATTLEEELGFDSLEVLELGVFLEGLGLELPEDLLPELRTLGDVYHYYTTKVGVHANGYVDGSHVKE